MAKYVTKKQKRIRRHNRIRQKIQGTAERPRLCVSLTAKHIYAQVIDDDKGNTLAASSSLDKAFAEQNAKSNTDGAAVIGKLLGERINQAGIKELVFDRGGFKYHGRIKALADAVREAGIKF